MHSAELFYNGHFMKGKMNYISRVLYKTRTSMVCEGCEADLRGSYTVIRRAAEHRKKVDHDSGALL
jgi:hypothetical protein